MRDETAIDLMASNLLGEKYDEACKKLMKNKEIIAPIFIIVRRGNDATEKGIFDYLSGLFESDLKKISHYVDTDKAEEYVKEVKDMTGLGASLINKGIQQGEERSIERLAEFFISKNPELTLEQAKEMATEILREGTDHR